MNIDVLVQQQGPLPINKQFQTGSTGPATLIVYGSVWSETANTEIGINILLDGQHVGTASIYSNGPSTHRAVVPAYCEVTLDKPFSGEPPSVPPTYTIELAPATGATTSDQNDSFLAVLHV